MRPEVTGKEDHPITLSTDHPECSNPKLSFLNFDKSYSLGDGKLSLSVILWIF